jgi:hypothetical protein
MAGYSGKPLAQKLGIKPGLRLIILNAPDDYAATLGALPDGVEQTTTWDGKFDFIQFFTTQKVVLETRFPELKHGLHFTGMLWISWPKKSSKLETDITEDIIRGVGLANGLVDVKVCAIDERWSGLKFVYRLEDRAD